MILSASRRTDLPAFYSTWWMNRVRAGFCEVPNPLRPSQVSRISLAPQDVDVVVFWTRNPLPMLAHLDELESRGLRSVFLVTLVGHPRELEPHRLSVERAVQAFQRLSRRLGPERVVWRYDPLVFSPATDADWHRRRFAELARNLRGFTRCCKLSLVDLYPRLSRRLRKLEGTPYQIAPPPPDGALLRDLLEFALENEIRLESCAEDLESFGIPTGACLDAEQLGQVFGLRRAAMSGCTTRARPGVFTAMPCVTSNGPASTGFYTTPWPPPCSPWTEGGLAPHVLEDAIPLQP
jgi:hypothetical protein